MKHIITTVAAVVILCACNSTKNDLSSARTALSETQAKLNKKLTALSGMRDKINGRGSAAFDSLTSTKEYEVNEKEAYRLGNEVDSLKMLVHDLEVSRNSQ